MHSRLHVLACCMIGRAHPSRLIFVWLSVRGWQVARAIENLLSVRVFGARVWHTCMLACECVIFYEYKRELNAPWSRPMHWKEKFRRGEPSNQREEQNLARNTGYSWLLLWVQPLQHRSDTWVCKHVCLIMWCMSNSWASHPKSMHVRESSSLFFFYLTEAF